MYRSGLVWGSIRRAVAWPRIRPPGDGGGVGGRGMVTRRRWGRTICWHHSRRRPRLGVFSPTISTSADGARHSDGVPNPAVGLPARHLGARCHLIASARRSEWASMLSEASVRLFDGGGFS